MPVCFGVDLSGTVAVNQTSTTAAKAKTEAINLARRQILSAVLANYADVESMTALLENTEDKDLIPFISASSVANEQISSDSYSANITMFLDNDVIKQWLIANNIQNWIPSSDSAEKFSLFIVVPNGVSDWAELKKIARENDIEIETTIILGNQIFAQMPLSARTKFTSVIKESDWKFADNNGTLQIWK